VAYRLAEHWIWDSWLADAGDERHLFHLQAPRSLGDPDLRHRNATIGHAVSRDLVSWTTLPTALEAGPPGAWDGLATWTGSVIEAGGTWYLFYTGIAAGTLERVQQIGVATSRDLVHWERLGDAPVIAPDPRWYVVNDGTGPVNQAWRDPWVFRDPAGDGYLALITATGLTGPRDGRGVIGHAVSADLLHWEVRPPIEAPSGFGELEVPGVKRVGDDVLLSFSAGEASLSAARRAARPGTGTYVVRARHELGPFRIEASQSLAPVSPLYAGHAVRGWDGTPVILGFVGLVDGRFVGELADPQPLEIGTIPKAS
jgi:beta-fructofuranosidase